MTSREVVWKSGKRYCNVTSFTATGSVDRIATHFRDLSGFFVSSSFLEIVQLPSGEIVLQRTDQDGEPLINIRFSDESTAYIGEAKMDIAKVMIQAGIQAVAHMDLPEDEDAVNISDDVDEDKPRVLH